MHELPRLWVPFGRHPDEIEQPTRGVGKRSLVRVDDPGVGRAEDPELPTGRRKGRAQRAEHLFVGRIALGALKKGELVMNSVFCPATPSAEPVAISLPYWSLVQSIAVPPTAPRIASSKSSSLNGLKRYAAAPDFSTRSRVKASSWAVMKMIGMTTRSAVSCA
jgi:hypothetical protein